METMLRRISEDLAKIFQRQDETEKVRQTGPDRPTACASTFSTVRTNPSSNPNTDASPPYGDWVFSTLAWEISRYKTFKIELEGHTETGPGPDREAHTKWELSADRANAARRKLVQNGVSAAQVCKVSGYADTEPMPGLPPTAEINRRVTVLLKLKETLANLSAAARTVS